MGTAVDSVLEYLKMKLPDQKEEQLVFPTSEVANEAYTSLHFSR